MGLDIRHFRMFMAAVDEGSISRAAKRLHMTQPAVSRSLIELERRLDVRLLVRSGQGVTLTEEGAYFYEKAVVVVRAFESAVRMCDADRRPIRISHAWSALGLHTSRIVRLWKDLHPDVPLHFHRVDIKDDGLSRGDFDIAVLRHEPPGDDVETFELFSEHRVMAAPVGHPLTRRKPLKMADLAGHPIIIDSVTGTTSLSLWNPGSSPLPTIEVGTVEDWQIYIAAELGIGVTQASTEYLCFHHGIEYIPLVDAPPVPIRLAWKKTNRHPMLSQFVEISKTAVVLG